MERTFTDFSSLDPENFKQKLLYFGMEYSNFCLLENNGYHFDKSIDCIAALGSINIVSDAKKNSVQEISAFQKFNKDWIFGHVAYDFKNKIESLNSVNFDGIGFPDFEFYVPEIVIIIAENNISIGVKDKIDVKIIYEAINNVHPKRSLNQKPFLTPRFHREEYLKTVEKLKEHIAKGDCYEVCFCMEYYCDNCSVNPVETFIRLNQLSPNPFAAFYKKGNRYSVV